MPNPPVKLNDLTKDEIQHLRTEVFKKKLEKKGSEKACRHCGHKSLMRPDQKYCSAKCRKAAYDENVVLTHELLRREAERWKAERQELLREISELKERLKQYEA